MTRLHTLESDGRSRIYHWHGAGESITIEKAQNGWLYSIPEIGIAAGNMYINDVRIGFDDYIHVKAAEIVHDPDAGPHGTIEITAFKRDGTY